ncbi:MAG: sulfotransferase [Proteobacteria bacterium]|nr:sulfotransferase [Pseudomonadota bacterium]
MQPAIQDDLNRDFRQLLNAGLQQHKSGDYACAYDFYAQALRINPDHALLNNLLGMLARQQGKYIASEIYFKKAVQAEPDNQDFLFNLALINFELEKYVISENLVIRSLHITPDNADFFNLLGKIYLKTSNPDKALGAFFAALKVNPGHEKSLYSIANVYRQSYEPDKAEKYFRKLLDLNPAHINSLYKLSCLCRLDNVEHKETIEKLIHQDLDNIISRSRLFLTKGHLLHNEKEYRSAFKFFQKAKRLMTARETVYNKKIYEQHLEFIVQDDERHDHAEYINDCPGPCMILGPSMSGKSLVEHLLNKSTDVVPGYENQVMFKTAGVMNARTNGNFDARIIQEDYRREIREFYFRFHENLFQDNQFTTSTRPKDIFLLLPFLNAIPEMRLICCFRDPLDTAMMMYMRDYESGNNYHTELNNCLHYIYHYHQTMHSLQKRFPRQVLPIRYETLVTNTRDTLQKIADFCNTDLKHECETRIHDRYLGISRHYLPELSELPNQPGINWQQ